MEKFKIPFAEGIEVVDVGRWANFSVLLKYQIIMKALCS